jgi:ABC-type antimicrobial peptide transport system permease subunit
MVRQPAIAEELVQDTFVRAFRAAPRYEPTASVSTWLFQTAARLAMNEAARAYHAHEHLRDPPEVREQTPGPLEELESKELGRALEVTTLIAGDAEALGDGLSHVRLVAPVQAQKLPVKWRDLSTHTNVVGTTPVYLTAKNARVESGRGFEQEEIRGALRVAVLGPSVVANVFGDFTPIGESVRINKIPFEVIGVLEARGVDALGQDQDDVVLVPISTGMRRLFNLDHVNSIYVQAGPGQTARAMEEVREVLRRRHRIREGKDDDFTLQDQTQALSTEMEAARSFTGLIAAVSAVALLIGGVGILAVMLIAIRERIREIGLRRAVGATERDVLVQFVLEALVISVLGGFVGLGLGVTAAVVAARLGDWPLVVSLGSVLLAVGVSTAVGVLFGAYPARRAARLDPTVALRSA